jgi:arylsulfatase A-like enzyme
MAKRPNIIIICTDEQRADHLGCMGHPDLHTPNIDRLAGEGTLFRHCYSSSPICMPARATMMTGHTMRVHGVVDNSFNLPRHLPTLPGMLADAGYRTHAIGKLHLRNCRIQLPEGETGFTSPEGRKLWDWPGRWKGSLYKHFPPNYYGYQTVEMANGHVHYVFGDYVTWLEENHPGTFVPGYKCSNDDPHPLSIDPELHYNTWIADRSIAFIKDQTEGDTAGEPFYLWCSFPDPHEPFAAVKKWSDYYDDVAIELPPQTLALSPDSRSKTMTDAGLGVEPEEAELVRKRIKQTYGMISHVDEQVGRILDCLSEQGVADNTVVMFIADHGDQLGEHGLFYKGVYPYDAHAHIPFIVKVPGGRAGKTVDDVVSMLDLVPTALDLAGVEPASPLPGEVLGPVMKSDAEPQRKNALVEIDSASKGDRLIQMRWIVTNEHKLVYYPSTGETMLFDRANDPNELKNLADDPALQPMVMRLLKQLLSELSRTEMPQCNFQDRQVALPRTPGTG